ncbi:hypothetical protein GCM10020229_49270 [Kitasatospora albolonga]
MHSGPAGYRIDVEGKALDAARFTALTAEARATDRPAERARLLTEALELWRGPAFADFADRPFALAAAAGLDEARLTAEEELAEARIDLGQHRELLPRLADLTTRHPLRQRLCAVRLRALYRSGRQDEALEAYAELRRALADQFGLDPEPSLAALHRQILRRDPTLLPPADTGNLPAPVSELVGRDGPLAQVRELLAAGRLVTLTGPAASARPGWRWPPPGRPPGATGTAPGWSSSPPSPPAATARRSPRPSSPPSGPRPNGPTAAAPPPPPPPTCTTPCADATCCSCSTTANT